MKEARQQRSKNKQFYGKVGQEDDGESCAECGRPITVREICKNDGLCDVCFSKADTPPIP